MPNYKHILAAPLISLFCVFILIVLIQQGLEKFVYPQDFDVPFAFSLSDYVRMDIYAYAILIIPTLFVQAGFLLIISKRYKSGKTILGLKLWPLILLACMLFAVIVCYITWNTYEGFRNLMLKICIAFLLAIIYWTINLFLMKGFTKSINGG